MLARRNADSVLALQTSLPVLAVTQPDPKVTNDDRSLRCAGFSPRKQIPSPGARLTRYGNIGMLDINLFLNQ
jgi:hypothetical protein